MESETQSSDTISGTEHLSDNTQTSEQSSHDYKMAPQENDHDTSEEADYGDSKENYYGSQHVGKVYRDSEMGGVLQDWETHKMVSTDDGEDGEILEDGEIASDQDGEMRNGDDGENGDKSSPSKSRGTHKDDVRGRKKNKHKLHSKRRRSKEEGHKDKQPKKKRHRDYIDYDKAGDDQEPGWIPTDKKERADKKGRSPPEPYLSPSHDSHGEERHKHEKDGEKHRRGSGDNRHHRGRDRDKDHERDSKKAREPASREFPDREKRDRHDKSDKEKKERKREKGEDYDSPPGIYDSPSDEEYADNRFGGQKQPKTMMSMLEDEYMDPTVAIDPDLDTMPFNKQINKKLQKKKQWFERQRQREREFDDGDGPPPKKKPLLATPMDERPFCRFYKEGKCQKGADCPFQHNEFRQKRMELCRYYVQSNCWKQEECVYMHSDFPCKYFHTGSTCYKGDNCKFSHAPLTPETEEALHKSLREREEENAAYEDGYDDYDGFEGKKFRKKGLLGDQPLTQMELDDKLEKMKHIPSIFDIEVFAPGDSPRKAPQPPPSMIRPQGFYQDTTSSMPNQRFNGPPNQGGPQRPPFMPPGPGMDGPPPNMQGPPPMMGPGPPNMGGGPGMQGPGPQGPPPGMQGAPMGPPPITSQPMSTQAAALVGAILRAAPMLQQFRGPAPPGGPPTSMANDPRLMMQQGPPPNMGQPPPGPNMGQGPPPGNMLNVNQNMMGPQGSMMSPNQMNMGMLSPNPHQDNMMGQGGQDMDIDQDDQDSVQDFTQGKMPAMQKSSSSRDPRMMTAQGSSPEDPRRKLSFNSDTDGWSTGHGDGNQKNTTLKGNTTPQQDWDTDMPSQDPSANMDIPEHLPPKQREMFMRIKQHTMQMNQQRQEQNVSGKRARNTGQMKADDDKWYSSDEEDDNKPNIGNILQSLSQTGGKQEPPSSTGSSAFNVMQMINTIKNSAPNSSPSRSNTESGHVFREPTIISSREGDCPWRLCRVLYVKQRIPTNVDLSDTKFKTDPRVQKILKMQELESGRVIDHSKKSYTPESQIVNSEQKHPLLDPRRESSLPRPELAPFVDPRQKKVDDLNPRMPEALTKRPSDPRTKLTDLLVKPADPRVQRPQPPNTGTAMHNLPVRPMDPRLSRQDSNSSVNNSGGRPFDPRLSRQNSQEAQQNSPNFYRSNTPPKDPRQLKRQSSNDPRQSPGDPRQSSGDPRLPNSDMLPPDLIMPKAMDPRLGRVQDSDMAPPSVQRQFSQPSTKDEKDAAGEPPKPKIDYRNDPRFKRKPISESNLPASSGDKRFTGQRKSSTEYSSPLGGDSSKQEEMSYNSYNRPRPPKSVSQTSVSNTSSISMTSDHELTTHDILDSLEIMPQPPAPDKNLKDIFKTIDPTASPFC